MELHVQELLETMTYKVSDIYVMWEYCITIT